MIKRYNNISLALGVPGIILQIPGSIMVQSADSTSRAVGLLILLLGTALLIAGLGFYAKAKGHSPLWGLCGFLSWIGLIILALLKDRTAGHAQ